MGQPMHAFDLDTLQGREINVRRAKDGEKIVTLDEKEFTLNSENLVICDGDKPAALAGIMGGLNSEIKDTTRELLFEAAKFARDSIRKTSRSLGQHSDSSAMYEKGVNEYTTELAMKRALNLIQTLGCGIITTIHVDVKTSYSHDGAKNMTVSVEKINKLLGIKVPAEVMCDILKRLNFGVKLSGDSLNLAVPPYREDIDLYPDIAEEVIRMYGYDHVEGTFLPTAQVTNGGYNAQQKAENSVKNNLVAQGLYEISTYSFYSEKDLDMLHIPADDKARKVIKIKNPISEELSIMRTTLAPSMLNTIVRNLRRGNTEGKLFEIAKIYIADELPLKTFPKERDTLCLGIFGNYGFFALKGIIENLADSLHTRFEYAPSTKPFLHPGMCADIICDGETIGYLGMVDPTIEEELAMEKKAFIAEIDYEAMMAHAQPFKYKPLSKHPEIKRDLALVADRNITCAQIQREIFGACKYVTEANLFDVYEGNQIDEGKKSMAFTVTFTPKDEPITQENVDSYVKKILNSLKFKLNITLR
jgi:phenylalanyl-tRNA synthetase beta chain